MNLHLTRDEADRLKTDGRVVLFREGSCLHCGPRVSWHHDMDCGTLLEPPAEFVEAAKPCETCGGCGYVPHWRMTWHDIDCPDCLDGMRRIAAVVRCGADHINTYPGLCPFCRNDGLITVATVAVESGPDQQDDGQYALGIRRVTQ